MPDGTKRLDELGPDAEPIPQLPELHGLRRVQWQEGLFYTYGYAIDGEDVLRYFVDRKDQRHGLSRHSLEETLTRRKTPSRVKRWLRAQLERRQSTDERT